MYCSNCGNDIKYLKAACSYCQFNTKPKQVLSTCLQGFGWISAIMGAGVGNICGNVFCGICIGVIVGLFIGLLIGIDAAKQCRTR